jgi:NADPH2:quinone reductase
MRAVIVRKHGGADALRVSEEPDPVPGAGEVLVRNRAIGVNYVDIQHRTGAPYPVELPLIPGTEASGVVVAVGAGVGEDLVGRKVAHFGHLAGVYAELTAAPLQYVVPLDDDADLELVAASALAGTTAFVLTNVAVKLSPQHSVMVRAASGTTGSAVIQFAVAAGATVFGVASTPTRASTALTLGAAGAFSEDAGMLQQLRAANGGRGVDVVYDANGGPTFRSSLESLSTGGTLVLYGQSGGPVAPFDPALLSGLLTPVGGGSLGLRWVAASHYLATRDDRETALRAVMDQIARGAFTPRIGHRMPLEAAAEAHLLLAQRRAEGKIILIP